MKKIILLNGPSSSGKSTIARILQIHIKEFKNEKYGVISIDDFLKMTADEAIYEDDVFEISSELCDKSLEILAVNNGIIIDHVITSERIFKQLTESLKGYKIYSVHITCHVNELIKRENERKNRCIGSAEASYQYLYPQDDYDLTVDTSELSPEECSLKIIDAVFSKYIFGK